jgi:hypothetical protein
VRPLAGASSADLSEGEQPRSDHTLLMVLAIAALIVMAITTFGS